MALPRIPKALVLFVPFMALLASPADALAVDVGLRAEGGIAVPLFPPQLYRFKLGGAGSVKGFIGLGRYVDAQVGFTGIGLPALRTAPSQETGTAYFGGLGFRLKRPHDAELKLGGLFAASPWLDGNLLYGATGSLNRFGLDIGAGISIPLDKARKFWIGPFARYTQILQPHRDGFDNADAKIAITGLNFEFGSSPLRPVKVVRGPEEIIVYEQVAEECPPPVYVAVPDRDHDGTADADDYCPDVVGPYTNHGCPIYKRLTVHKQKLELNEKIMFAFDKSIIEEVSYPLLDDVVLAMLDNKSFRVKIEGHTDSTGTAAYNQTLSEQRAAAVLAYLEAHGVARNRLSSKGFSESVPVDTNTTAEGRENNRRVDFVVRFNLVDDPDE